MAAFPDMDSHLIEKTMEECGNCEDFDSVIEKLNELCLGYHANINSETTTLEDASTPSNNLRVDGAEWVEFLVNEMMNSTSVDDAKSCARKVLENLESSIRAEAAENLDKEKIILKERTERLTNENVILKRAVAIQHKRQKENYNARNQEVEELKQLVAEYQQRLTSLEMNNYALRMHLQQADHQGNSIPNRFRPDVF
ncbi:hypothetical protein ACH5RR_039610 [Cinchona calisaya]|uniref:CUE domain-containing protein n=1 Tax=Cinchona calisaya TaxID=153742 RepID=A0ABD2XYR4_9GENT